MTKKSYKEINADQAAYMQSFMKESKNTLNSFMQLHQATMSEGAVSLKNKELIALGISIAVRCDGCIGAHVKAALNANATKEEIVEAINVAVLMGGGPSLTYGAQALAAAEELAE
ncbi:carboxymuconolactone decarboxylase family protein [Vibrio alginolyticus]|nr:carboxymuconolactone decarboxylase family protein [Vibrio parahaemolyticus]ELA7389036.1 carboxymuconolactone decarboxylase family protein [Vibrio alginolyticus]WMN90556.1 carboxymuconolactone decarboxylase family protein [Vibrio parahaemolyticus]WMO08216.1 carboxymuconolactone decarboxylase family protein [Vibrio parahaemolyticus]